MILVKREIDPVSNYGMYNVYLGEEKVNVFMFKPFAVTYAKKLAKKFAKKLKEKNEIIFQIE